MDKIRCLIYFPPFLERIYFLEEVKNRSARREGRRKVGKNRPMLLPTTMVAGPTIIVNDLRK